MATEHVTNRAILHFAEEVRARFSFLEMLGFKCVSSEPTFVRFESAKVSVNIYHGRHSFEIGLEIVSKSSPTNTYPFSAILRLVDIERANRYRNYATHTVQGVVEGLSKLAELFQACVAAGILDDEQLFVRLQHQREELVSNFALEVELEQARAAAETAWQKKDYAGVVAAFKSLRAALTATEIGKLEFAEKRCGKKIS